MANCSDAAGYSCGSECNLADDYAARGHLDSLPILILAINRLLRVPDRNELSLTCIPR